MRWIKAILALVALGAIAVAPPLLLVAFVGNPIPADVVVSAPLTDGALIKLISLVIWLLWAQTLWCVVAEVVAATRSASLTRTRGTFPIQQQLVRTLVGAIIALAISMPLPSLTGGASAEDAVVPAAGAGPTSVGVPALPALESLRAAAAPVDDPAVQQVVGSTVEVHRGDSLWSIAEERLGSGDRWADIAAMNEGRPMSGGRTFRTAAPIHPGWILAIPGDSLVSPEDSGEYIVQPGDTLSQIAQDRAGSADAWPDLFEQSAKINVAVPLTSPDLIYPGQRIILPADAHETPAPAPVEESSRSEEPHTTPPEVAESLAPRAVDGSAPEELTAVAAVNASLNDLEGSSESLPSWITPGLLGAGTLLAGSLLISLRNRRALQHRSRWPGRTISMTAPELVGTEKSVTVAGSTTADRVQAVDLLLKQLASALTAEQAPMPSLAAVEVTPAAVALHLRSKALQPPPPWAATGDGLVWVVQISVALEAGGLAYSGAPAPWPLLVTIGHDDLGSSWLLNAEDQTINLAGDAVATADFARFIAAEIACNPWSKATSLDLFGIAEEVAPMQPDRITVHDDISYAASEAVADIVRNIDRLNDYGVGTTTARARQDDPDPWHSRMLVLDRHPEADEFHQLRGLIQSHDGMTGAGVFVFGGGCKGGLEVFIDERRRLTITAANLTLTAVGLSSDEAHGCAALLAQADRTDDEAVADLDGIDSWRNFATQTGSLRDRHRSPRNMSSLEPSHALLSGSDEMYVEVAATTARDLEALSPQVAKAIRDEVITADPSLDADLAEWFSGSGRRPRLSLLGPVQAWTSGTAIQKRRAFYTELFAYLATRPFGATTDEVADAFSITPARVRVDVNKLRDWLGSDPTTGRYIPDARDAPSAHARGVGVYEVVGALVDVDLFRRLRLRGETSGPAGLTDLRRALELVKSRPFGGLRPGGWGWLLEGDRLDHHMTCAIVDVAHVIVTDALHIGDDRTATWAAGVAVSAAPDEDIARLDLVATLQAQGHSRLADEMLRDEVCNSDVGDGPFDLPDRSFEILGSREWPRRDAG